MKPDEHNLIIGIPARNEEKTIYDTLKSILDEAQYFPNSIDIKILVVINHSVDNTEAVVNRFCKKYQNFSKNISISKTYSKAGIIKAQKKVWDEYRGSETVIFVDADVVIRKKSILELYNHFAKSSAKAMWIPVKPIFDTKSLLSIARILNFRDCYQNIFTSRLYLYGKVFAIRDYQILKSVSISKYKVNIKLVELLRLNKGPLVDDIYLTRYLINSYGVDSIQRCEKALAYYNPITNLRDFYYSQRRTIIEMKRLDLLYPNLCYRTKDKKYLKRKINKYSYKTLPLNNKIEFYFYLFIYSSVRTFSIWECELKIFLAKIGFRVKPINIWPVLRSTKISFNKKIFT